MTTKQLVARIGLSSMVFIILGTLLIMMINDVGWFGSLIVIGSICGVMAVVGALMWCTKNL